jgi:fatty acyl-ACP thioesterase A
VPAQIEGPLQVARRSDMDMNGHINNVTYLGWALETVPPDVYLNYSLHEVWPVLSLCISSITFLLSSQV